MPPGVLGGLDTIQTDAGNGAADALNSLDGYVNPVCNPKAKRTPVVIRSDRAIGSFKTTVPSGGTLAHRQEARGG